MAKAKNEETALTIANYAVMKQPIEELMNIIGANLGANAELGPGDLERIKVPAGGGTTWSIPGLDGDIDTKEFDGVIVAFKDQRAYWEDSYSGGSTPPDCSSEDGITGVGSPGGDCGACPYAQFESATGDDGSKRAGQACKQLRLMAVVQNEDLIPVLLAAPPTSLANMRRYFLRLASRVTPYYGVITRFTLKKAQSQGGITYSQIEATSLERLDEGQRSTMEQYSKVISKSLERRSAADQEDYE